MTFRVNNFKTYKAKADIRLGHVNPTGEPPRIQRDEVFEFDGFTIRLKDGREFAHSEGFQGMVEKGFVLEVAPKKKVIVHPPSQKREEFLQEKKKEASRKVKVSFEEKKKTTSDYLFEALDSSFGVEEEVEEEDDFFEDEEEEPSLEEFEEEESEEEEVDDWDSEDSEEEDDWEEEEEEEEVDLGNGISLRNQTKRVKTSWDLSGNSGSSQSFEGSATAMVGSVTQAQDGGVYVGSGGGLPGDRQKKASNKIGFEGVQSIQTVAILPTTISDVANTKPTDVSNMGLNSIARMEESMGGLRAQPVGVGKKMQEQRKMASDLKNQKIQKMIEKRASVLEEIRKTIPKFKWDLNGDPIRRFEKAMSFYERSKTSSKDKKSFEAILKYELPDMQKRIKQEIKYLENPRPKS